MNINITQKHVQVKHIAKQLILTTYKQINKKVKETNKTQLQSCTTLFGLTGHRHSNSKLPKDIRQKIINREYNLKSAL